MPRSGWQWLGVIVCGISYYMGITRALFLITPPVTGRNPWCFPALLEAKATLWATYFSYNMRYDYIATLKDFESMTDILLTWTWHDMAISVTYLLLRVPSGWQISSELAY